MGACSVATEQKHLEDPVEVQIPDNFVSSIQMVVWYSNGDLNRKPFNHLTTFNHFKNQMCEFFKFSP